jgi:hypothetical protein
MVGVNSNSLEQKSRIQSALITVGVQVLLFLAFYFIVVWEQPDPPKPTYGMELNLGFSDLGAGDQSQIPATTSETTVTEAPAPGEVMPTQQAVAATTPKTTSSKPSTYQAVSTQPSPIKGGTTATAAPAKEEQKEVNPKVVEQPKVDLRVKEPPIPKAIKAILPVQVMVPQAVLGTVWIWQVGILLPDQRSTTEYPLEMVKSYSKSPWIVQEKSSKR